MRILFISAMDFPYPLDRGSRYHIHYWLKALSGNHEIDYLLVDPSSARRDRSKELLTARVINLGETPNTAFSRRLMRLVRSAIGGTPAGAMLAMPRGAVAFVRQAVEERRYDLAILWGGNVASYAALLRGAVPTIVSQLSVDAVNARDQRKRAGMWNPRWALAETVVRRFEARTCRAATAVCTVNDEDKQEFVRRYGLKNVVQAIPIGVELQKFAKREREPNGKIVGFTGDLAWGANVDAVNWLIKEIAPTVLAAHREVRFRIIGRGCAALREEYGGPRVEFTGYVSSVRDAMEMVSVGVVPVFSGTGMRLKLLELLSVGIPSVTTTLGAAGLPVAHGEHVLIADDTAQFASAVNRLLTDAALRARLSKNGPELAKQYAWGGIEQRVRDLVSETMAAAVAGDVAAGSPVGSATSIDMNRAE